MNVVALPKRDIGNKSCWVSDYSLPVQCSAWHTSRTLFWRENSKLLKALFMKITYLSILVFFPSHCRKTVQFKNLNLHQNLVLGVGILPSYGDVVKLFFWVSFYYIFKQSKAFRYNSKAYLFSSDKFLTNQKLFVLKQKLFFLARVLAKALKMLFPLL